MTRAGLVIGMRHLDAAIGSRQPTGYHAAIEGFVGALAGTERVRELAFFDPEPLASAEPAPTRDQLVGRARAPAVSYHRASLATVREPVACDVFHDHTMSLLQNLQLRELGITGSAPFTFAMHGAPLPFADNQLAGLLLQDVRPDDTFICSSPVAKQQVQAGLDWMSERLGAQLGTAVRLPLRLEVIPYGVDTATFTPGDRSAARRELGLPLDATIVLCLGRISPSIKADVLPLLKAFRALVLRNPGTNLVLVFAGYFYEPWYRGVVESFLEELALPAGAVVFLDRVEPARTPTVYACADVCVALSDCLGENFGLVPIEAMACGVPQVVSAWNGYRTTVVDGATGFHVPTWWSKCDDDLAGVYPFLTKDSMFFLTQQTIAIDVDALTERLHELVGNPALRATMAEASRRRAVEVYDWGVVIAQYVALWDELIASSRGRHGRPRLPPVSLYDACRTQTADVLEDHHVVALATDRETSLPIYGALEALLSLDACDAILGGLEDTGPVEVGEVVAAHAASGTRAHWLRHVLFLVKHGFLTVRR
jgi:D-inositol-3-phosphate glycosyltransferase